MGIARRGHKTPRVLMTRFRRLAILALFALAATAWWPRAASAADSCAWNVLKPYFARLPEFALVAEELGPHGLLVVLARETSPRHLLVAVHTAADNRLVTFQTFRNFDGGAQSDEALNEALSKLFAEAAADRGVLACKELRLPDEADPKDAYKAMGTLYATTFGITAEPAPPAESPGGTNGQSCPWSGDACLVASLLGGLALLAAAVAFAILRSRKRRKIKGSGDPAQPPPADRPAPPGA
jgi:hypothetical protein